MTGIALPLSEGLICAFVFVGGLVLYTFFRTKSTFLDALLLCLTGVTLTVLAIGAVYSIWYALSQEAYVLSLLKTSHALFFLLSIGSYTLFIAKVCFLFIEGMTKHLVQQK